MPLKPGIGEQINGNRPTFSIVCHLERARQSNLACSSIAILPYAISLSMYSYKLP